QGGAARVGVVLLNIGTPNSLDLDDVADYLGRFLGDRRVVSIQDPEERSAVLTGVLGAQPAKSVESYARIWDPVRGSPLRYHMQDLAAALQGELGPAFEVHVGFQHSEPSVDAAMARLAALDVDRGSSSPARRLRGRGPPRCLVPWRPAALRRW
ncbi:unnamed protein product, partial [Prorocentrum cordatum]